MTLSQLTMSGVALGVLTSASALAQPVPVDQPVTTQTSEEAAAAVARYEDPGRGRLIGLAVTAGGGVQGFTGDTLRGATTDGGNWDVRVSVGTRSYLGFEASYLGSLQSIDALGLDDGALLASHGVQGNLRLNFVRDQPVQPFVFVGAAWRRYDIVGTDTNTSDIDGEDNVLEAPIGVGVAIRAGGLVFDARGELRAASRSGLAPSMTGAAPNDTATMHRYGVNANAGFEF